MVAAYVKDESVRLQSSCGGIFTVLAERVLDDGGVVVGVAQTAPTRFRSGKSVSVHHGRSKYMRLFLSRICQNTSCDDCHYRKLPRIADITLGDYWGISKYHPEMDDNKGTSVVLLNTEHGKALFESVAGKVAQCDSKVEYAIAGNPCIVRSGKPHPKRTEFFTNLDKYPLDQLIKKYCPFPSPLKRAYIRVRGILGRVKRIVVKWKTTDYSKKRGRSF